jgi:hypothetical protein
VKLKFRTKTILAISLLLLLTGCDGTGAKQNPDASSQTTGQPTGQQAAQHAIDKAQIRYSDSQAAGHAWLQTKVHLQSAKQALQENQFAQAQARAERALALADASLNQAQAEQSAWRDRFPRTRPISE